MLKVRLLSPLSSRLSGVLPPDHLNELVSSELIHLAKTTTRYRNKITSGISVDKINYDELVSRKSQNLDITFIIEGKYIVIIRFEDFMYKLRQYYSELLKKSKTSSLTKTQQKSVISKALVNSLDTSTIRIRCSCPDFRYRFAYVATKGDYILGDEETRPARITNPHNKGSMCKHLSAVIGVTSRWRKRVVSDIYKLIQFDQTLLIK